MAMAAAGSGSGGRGGSSGSRVDPSARVDDFSFVPASAYRPQHRGGGGGAAGNAYGSELNELSVNVSAGTRRRHILPPAANQAINVNASASSDSETYDSDCHPWAAALDLLEKTRRKYFDSVMANAYRHRSQEAPSPPSPPRLPRRARRTKAVAVWTHSTHYSPWPCCQHAMQLHL